MFNCIYRVDVDPKAKRVSSLEARPGHIFDSATRLIASFYDKGPYQAQTRTDCTAIHCQGGIPFSSMKTKLDLGEMHVLEPGHLRQGHLRMVQPILISLGQCPVARS